LIRTFIVFELTQSFPGSQVEDLALVICIDTYTYRGKAANKEKNIELEANWNLAI
jgi:hypothetical protein